MTVPMAVFDGQHCATWLLKMSHRGLFGQEQPSLQSLLMHLQQAKFTGFVVLQRQGQAYGVMLYLLGSVLDCTWNKLRGLVAQQALQEAMSRGEEIEAEARRATRASVQAARAVLGGQLLLELRQPSDEQLRSLQEQTLQGYTGVIGRFEGNDLREVFAYADGRPVDQALPAKGSGIFLQYQAVPGSNSIENITTQATQVAHSFDRSAAVDVQPEKVSRETVIEPVPSRAATPERNEEQEKENVWQILENIFVSELGPAGTAATKRFRVEISHLPLDQQKQKMRERLEATLGSNALLQFQGQLANQER